jgi:hypothetical protein
LPDGQISSSPVQPPLQKYSGSLLTQITSSSSLSRPNTEGRFAIVTNVGQGVRWTQAALLTRALPCGRRSRVVLTPQWLASSSREAKLLGGDGDNKARSPRRARRKPLKPIACGNAGCSGATVVTNARAYYHYRRGCGCNGHPAFPTPSISGRRIQATTRTHRAAGWRMCILSSLRANGAALCADPLARNDDLKTPCAMAV